MSSPSNASSRGPLFYAWLTVLTVALGFVAWDSVVRSQHVLRVSENYGVMVNAPREDVHSPTGYENGRRSIILPDRSMDGYHWIMQTQTMLAEGKWRVRHADYDHAPDGREVHWGEPFRWWLASLAYADHVLSGRPLGISVERAALLTGPVMLGLLLIGVSLLLARRFSPIAAMLFIVGAVAQLAFYVDFVSGYSDHHGLVNACCMLSILCLLSHRGTYASARRWTIAGALAGGVGLWISAPTQVPVLIGLGLGALALCWLGRGSKEASIWTSNPKLFRIWGATGAAVSLAAYLIEYFPDHFGIRLEINHPLYALAWLGGGEALCRLAMILRSGPQSQKARDLGICATATAGVLLLPVVIFLTGDITFTVSDTFLWRLHNDFIAEFQSLPRFLQMSAYSWESLGNCLPFLMLVPALWLVFRRSTANDDKVSLALALAPALVVLPLSWNQVRWWGLEYATLVPVLATTLQTLQRSYPASKRSLIAFAAACTLAFSPGIVAAVQNTNRHADLGTDDIRSLAERDLAHWLRQRAGSEKVVIAASPTITTGLIFHGGLSGLGTLYWENKDGLKTAAALYAAPSEAEAREIVQLHGITHIVVITWDGFEGVYTRLARRLPATAPIPTNTFIVKLLTASVPPVWLREISYKLPALPAFEGQQIRIYEVTAEQTPADMLVHTTNFCLEMGMLEPASRLVSLMADYNDSLAIWITKARVAAFHKDAASFSKAMSQVFPKLPQSADLALEDHINLVSMLALAERFDLANDQLARCLTKATQESLRKLPAKTLADLLNLSESAGTSWPDPALRSLAISLIPPDRN